MSSSDESIGIYWGNSLDVDKLDTVENTPVPVRDPANANLLDVLTTLRERIALDTEKFMSKHKRDLLPAIAKTSSSCYPKAVVAESLQYVVDEKEGLAAKAHRESRLLQAQQLHTSVEDLQTYYSDRSSSYKRKENQKGPSRKISVVSTESSHHTRRMNHLLHILQSEIADETKREIQIIDAMRDGRDKRQSEHNLARITKERYEASDRIMRILEEYNIVIGIDIVNYLQSTIKKAPQRAILKTRNPRQKRFSRLNLARPI